MAKVAAQKKEKKKPPEHPQEERKALAARLKGVREEKEFTQLQVAQRFGFGGKQTISNWETGRNLPDALWLRKLANLYGVSVDALTSAESKVVRWPFSMELLKKISQLDADHVEKVIWAALGTVEEARQALQREVEHDFNHVTQPLGGSGTVAPKGDRKQK